MIICLSCGTPNTEYSGHCSKCNARLPKLDVALVGVGAGPMTGRFVQIKEATEKARIGEWSREEFGQFISNLFEFLEKHKDNIVGYVKETADYDYGIPAQPKRPGSSTFNPRSVTI